MLDEVVGPDQPTDAPSRDAKGLASGANGQGARPKVLERRDAFVFLGRKVEAVVLGI